MPVVDFRIYHDAPKPTDRFIKYNDIFAEWSGYIDIKSDDIYSFKLHNLNDAKIFIDNILVFKKEKSQDYYYPIKLNAGKKKIKIVKYGYHTYYDWNLAHAVRFMYKINSWKEFVPVPYYILSPDFNN